MCVIGVWDDLLGFVAQDALELTLEVPHVLWIV